MSSILLSCDRLTCRADDASAAAPLITALESIELLTEVCVDEAGVQRILSGTFRPGVSLARVLAALPPACGALATIDLAPEALLDASLLLGEPTNVKPRPAAAAPSPLLREEELIPTVLFPRAATVLEGEASTAASVLRAPGSPAGSPRTRPVLNFPGGRKGVLLRWGTFVLGILIGRFFV